MLALRDQVLDRLRAVVRRQRQAALVLVVAPEGDGARLLGDDRRVLRAPRLEQLRHPRQTAGDVASLSRVGGDAREDVAGLHRAARVVADDGVDREEVAGVRAARQLDRLALGIDDHHRRLEVRGARRAAPVDDDALGDAGRLVGGLGDRLAVDHVLVHHDTVRLGDDRTGVGVPLCDALAALDLVAVVDAQARAVLQAVHRPLRSIGADDHHGHVSAGGDQVAVRVLGDRAVADLDRAFEARLDEG